MFITYLVNLLITLLFARLNKFFLFFIISADFFLLPLGDIARPCADFVLSCRDIAVLLGDIARAYEDFALPYGVKRALPATGESI